MYCRRDRDLDPDLIRASFIKVPIYIVLTIGRRLNWCRTCLPIWKAAVVKNSNDCSLAIASGFRNKSAQKNFCLGLCRVILSHVYAKDIMTSGIARYTVPCRAINGCVISSWLLMILSSRSHTHVQKLSGRVVLGFDSSSPALRLDKIENTHQGSPSLSSTVSSLTFPATC